MESAWLMFLSYVFVFFLLSLRWIGHTVHAIPLSQNPNDMKLSVWILAWVSHALFTQPGRLFEANINYPAGAQLTGSEHFVSTQIVFAPLYWATGNPVLAANVIVLLSYPVAALVMASLTRALGCVWPVAWVVGLIFALGPRQVPMSLRLLQYLVFYFPLVALALTRLREQQSKRAAVLLVLALAAGVFSSYYAAVFIGLIAAIWGTFELLRDRPGRLRFTLLALVAAVAVMLLLGAFSWPYFARTRDLGVKRAGGLLPPLGPLLATMVGRVRRDWTRQFGDVALGLAGLGVLTLGSRERALRRVAALGLTLTVAGLFLSVHFPRGLIPFFRYPRRFIVVSGFGVSLMGAAALQQLVRWVGPRAGGALLMAIVVAILATRGRMLTSFRPLEIHALSTDAPIYHAVGKIVRAAGGGALLELPILGRGSSMFISTFEPDAMLGSTRHWLPLISGFTGYQPPHRKLLLETIGELPAQFAVDDLVDMTHVRWLLLRPPRDWEEPDARTKFLEGIWSSCSEGARWHLGDWMLLQLNRMPAHPEWFRAIARGTQAGKTVLGTALAPLPRATASARVSVSTPPKSFRAGQPLYFDVEVENTGSASWPVAVAPPRASTGAWSTSRFVSPTRYTVQLVSRWRSRESGAEEAIGLHGIPLQRDVSPGDKVRQHLWIAAPHAPGLYELEIKVEQLSGSRFDSPGSSPFRRDFAVAP